MNSLRRTDIKFLKGFGPKRAELLEKELGIRTYYDLLHHFPSHYIDRSTFTQIKSFYGEMNSVQVKGRFVTLTIHGEGARKRLIGLFTDGTATMEIVWFRKVEELRKFYRPGVEYILFGKPTVFNNCWQMTHPEIEESNAKTILSGGLRGVYPLTEKLRNNSFSSKTFYVAVKNILETVRDIKETLPEDIISSLRLMPLGKAIETIHNPQNVDELKKAQFRLKFEELFYIQLDIKRKANFRKRDLKGHIFKNIGHYFNSFYSRCLTFELTGAQKKVIKDIRMVVLTGRQMNRLVQGDVGSGKTLVALMAMLMALDN